MLRRGYTGMISEEISVRVSSLLRVPTAIIMIARSLTYVVYRLRRLVDFQVCRAADCLISKRWPSGCSKSHPAQSWAHHRHSGSNSLTMASTTIERRMFTTKGLPKELALDF